MTFKICLAIATLIASNVQAIGTNEWTIDCPCGLVSMWFGDQPYPDGYQLCDGSNNTPNLIGKFIIGSSNRKNPSPSNPFPPLSTGGSNQITLTTDHLPEHAHGVGSLTITGGTHPHSVTGTADSDSRCGHSHDLGDNARVCIENDHKHGIPRLTTSGIDDGEHDHEIEGMTTRADDASHVHEINFNSQGENTAHTHTVPAHRTSGGGTDGEHGHFILAYEDEAIEKTLGGYTINGLGYETLGGNPPIAHYIGTNDTSGIDGSHPHDINAQQTAADGPHDHAITGSTNDDGDHDHDIEGGTIGVGDGAHNHTTPADTTTTNSGHDHTLGGETEKGGRHSHELTAETSGTNDGKHSHDLTGDTAKSTGGGKAIDSLPEYVALQFICCTNVP